MDTATRTRTHIGTPYIPSIGDWVTINGKPGYGEVALRDGRRPRKVGVELYGPDGTRTLHWCFPVQLVYVGAQAPVDAVLPR